MVSRNKAKFNQHPAPVAGGKHHHENISERVPDTPSAFHESLHDDEERHPVSYMKRLEEKNKGHEDRKVGTEIICQIFLLFVKCSYI
jgi:hypothetical protein